MVCLPAGLPLQTTSSSKGICLLLWNPQHLVGRPLPRGLFAKAISIIIVHLGAAYPASGPLMQECTTLEGQPNKVKPQRERKGPHMPLFTTPWKLGPTVPIVCSIPLRFSWRLSTHCWHWLGCPWERWGCSRAFAPWTQRLSEGANGVKTQKGQKGSAARVLLKETFPE